MPEDGIIGPELAAKIAELQRLDERDRQRSLAQAEGGLGPAPVAIEAAPRGTYPIVGGGVAGEPATLAVPSRSSYDMMSPQERRDSFDNAGMRGTLASMVAGGVLGSGFGGPAGPSAAEALFGGVLAGGALSAPSALMGSASDMAAGEVFRTPDTAGTFTAGPRMAAELEGRYSPEQPRPYLPYPFRPQRMGIEGQTISPTSVEGAAERVEIARAQERAQEQFLIAQRQREMEEHQRRLAEARAQEAARQSGLSETFGTPEERARTILALTDLR